MSMPRYGRITPLQGDVLSLAGEHMPWGNDEPPPDAYRLTAMKSGREALKKLTGKDFGYDLAAWNDFLLKSAKYSEEYTFDYAWKAVKHRVDELVNDPDRLRLVALCKQTEPEGV